MRIGVLGSGNVGQALAAGFVDRGHDVRLGSRDPGAKTPRAGQMATYDDAADFADLAVLATPWDGTENALALAGADRLAGKTVIDVTNPLDFSTGRPVLVLGHVDSGGEQVQQWLADSAVVKAFNIINYGHMVDPEFPGGPPDMFLCGNDAPAKAQVTEICQAFGWPSVIDVGGIEGARLLEPLAMLWIECAMRWESVDHGWKVLRK